jgi:hypothetical protein
MSVPTVNPFPADALDANRQGQLSDAQRRGFGGLAASNRRSALSSAGLLGAGALVVAWFASPNANPVTRGLVIVIALAVAAILVVRAVTGSDALTRDLREGRVESVEGAIGKRRPVGGGGGSMTTYFLDVGDRTFKVRSGTYDAAPGAGIVRLYYLPHSRKVVNLEHLSGPPVPDAITPQGVLESLRDALLTPGKRQRNEARAELASIGEAAASRFTHSAQPPPGGARDPRPLAQAILGTWTNGMMNVTFATHGQVTVDMLGHQKTGSWSVDAAGHLHSDIMGSPQSAEAWIVGAQLTIAFEGEGMVLRRVSGS